MYRQFLLCNMFGKLEHVAIDKPRCHAVKLVHCQCVFAGSFYCISHFPNIVQLTSSYCHLSVISYITILLSLNYNVLRSFCVTVTCYQKCD